MIPGMNDSRNGERMNDLMSKIGRERGNGSGNQHCCVGWTRTRSNFLDSSCSVRSNLPFRFGVNRIFVKFKEENCIDTFQFW